MPLFTKKQNELVTQYDKWCSFLKHLEEFDDIPAILNEPIFQKAFKTAGIAKFSKEEYDKYQEGLLNYIELKGVVDTSKEEGKLEILKEMIKENLPIEQIARLSKLPVDTIEKLINEMKYKL